MKEKRYSRKEPTLAAPYTAVREFYAKEEFYLRFFERLSQALKRHYGLEKASEILRAISNVRVRVTGLEEFFNAKKPYDIGTRAFNKVKQHLNENTYEKYLSACEEAKEQVLVRGYKDIDITSILINATKVTEDFEKFEMIGERLANIFSTYGENPFTFDFYTPPMLKRLNISRGRYTRVMTGFINTLMAKFEKGVQKIPHGSRVQLVSSDSRRVALACIKDEFRNYSIKSEVNGIFSDIEEFGIDEEKEIAAFEKVAELIDRPYIFAHWLRDRVLKILQISNLRRYIGMHVRPSHYNKDYPQIPYKTLVHVTTEDKYLAEDSVKEGMHHTPFVNIEMNCSELSMKVIEANLDLLIMFSLTRERLLGAVEAPINAVHRVILKNCTKFNQQFIEEIQLRARKLASKYNREVEIQVCFHPKVAESKSGVGDPEYLRVISDLHVDVNMERGYDFDLGKDFIINAGDTSGNYATTADWVRTHVFQGVFVAGNHLGYDSKYGRNGVPALISDTVTKILESRASQKEKLENSFRSTGEVAFLENRFIKRHDIFFWGSELKSDFRIFGEDNQVACMMEAGLRMNDFRRCVKLKQDPTKAEGERGVVSTYSPEDHLSEATAAIKALNKHLNVMQTQGPDTPVVLVTHFVPSIYGVAEQYKHDPLTAAFASDFSWVIEKFPNVRLWVFGHTHSQFDFIYKQCRFVCNPFGYFNENKVDIENYGTRIKLSDIKSKKSWNEILHDEIQAGIIKVYG